MKHFKPNNRFHQAAALIVIGILSYTLINHLSVISTVFWFLTDLLQPLIIGGIVAFFLNVPMRVLERHLARFQEKHGKKIRTKFNSTISLLITYIGSFFLIFMVFYILVPQLIETVPPIITSIENSLPRFYAFLESHNIDSAQIKSLLSGIDLGVLIQTLVDNYEQIINTSLSAVSSVVEVLMLAVSGFVISIYILANKTKLQRQVRKVLYAYVDKRHADRISAVASLTNKTFSNFLSGQCLESLILGCMFFITMSIMRLPFAPVISVFIAFTAMIPYVGAFLGGAVGALLIVTVSPMQSLIFLITFMVLQQVEEQLVYPRVVGGSVGLSPIWILVSIFVGGKLFGVMGMLFFIPLTSVIYSLLRTNVANRLQHRGLEVTAKEVIATPTEEPVQPSAESEPPEVKE